MNYLTQKEALNLILKLEQNSENFIKKLKYKDIELWNPLRTLWFSYFIGEQTKRYSKLSKKSLLFSLLKKIIKPYNLNKNDILCISPRNARRSFMNSQFDIFVDWIGVLTNLKYSLIDIPDMSKNITLDKPFTDKIISGEKMLMLSVVKARIIKPKLAFLGEYINSLLDKIPYEKNREEILELSMTTISRFIALIDYFEKIIQKTKPKLIIEVCSYNLTSRALTVAAKKNEIKTLEIQHGLINPSHGNYIYKKLLSKQSIPDEIIVFGNFYKNLLIKESNMFLEENIHVGGNLYIESKIKDSLSNNIKKIKEKAANKKIALITTQPIYSNSAYDSIIKKLQELDFFIIIKPHQSDPKSKFDKYRKIVLVSNESLYELLKITDINITISSTTAIDALLFSVPSLVIDSNIKDNPLYFLKNTKGINFLNEGPIEDKINQTLLLKNNRINSSEFLVKGSRTRLVSLVKYSLMNDAK